MEKDLCSNPSHNFADLMSSFYSPDYVLPGNKITKGEVKQVLRSHFEDRFKKRYEPYRVVIESAGFGGMDGMVNEKVCSLRDIMVFLFSEKKPTGMCVVTRSDNSKAKSDKFYTELTKVRESLLGIEEKPDNEIFKFYPSFQNEYAVLVKQFNLLVKNLDFLGGYNQIVSDKVIDAIHWLKMNPEAYSKEEIRELINESVQVIKKAFPEVKQYQETNILQQYFAQELNYEVVLHGEEGPRRLNISDKTKSERREAEEKEFKKRGL